MSASAIDTWEHFLFDYYAHPMYGATPAVASPNCKRRGERTSTYSRCDFPTTHEGVAPHTYEVMDVACAATLRASGVRGRSVTRRHVATRMLRYRYDCSAISACHP